MPHSPADTLLSLLDLTPARDASGAVIPDRFIGPTESHPGGHVFGGQVMGQAVVAAGRTVAEDRHIHSMHAYFLRAGDPREQISFEVERLRDGNSFTARRVMAIQHERPILVMTASFQMMQDGLEHQDCAPDAPDPDTLPTTAEVLDGVDHPTARYWSTARPIDIRHVTDPIYIDPAGEACAQQMVWMRAISPIDAPDLVHDAILAFATDYTPFEPILRRHGLAWSTPGVRAASLDHAIWWHRRPNINQWMLYVQQSPSASGGRGLTTGKVFSRDGSLLATVTQEGMLRPPRRS
ncbi:acyl-CoA thioesterase [Devriesea agamarum]|uniref:acyl-CoA thioesterase n=1 Tax=Devriesea agamarum TaxID=472569 RepID=UPI00071DDEF4|nr:acyl-CoA thioesterase II [Devriesea agamarum]